MRIDNVNDYKVLLISGAGRSGSTLLTIILDNHKDCFAAGELINYVSNGIFNDEYCSCGEVVSQCSFWPKVQAKWDQSRQLSLEEYNRIQRSVTKNRGTFRLLKNMIAPSREFKIYIEDTKRLYQCISEISGKKYIIDASKPAQRILVLRKCGIDFSVLHLTRKFSLVLNSNKKSFKKDLKAGLEKDTNPQKTSYVLKTWLINNFFARMFSIGGKRIRIKYEHIINDLSNEIKKIIALDPEFEQKIKDRGPFTSEHIVAGNRIRMNKELNVAKEARDNKLKNLTSSDKSIAKLIDLFYGKVKRNEFSQN